MTEDEAKQKWCPMTKTFKMEDLVGRNLDVKRFDNEDGTTIAATDTASGEFFILEVNIKEVNHDRPRATLP